MLWWGLEAISCMPFHAGSRLKIPSTSPLSNIRYLEASSHRISGASIKDYTEWARWMARSLCPFINWHAVFDLGMAEVERDEDIFADDDEDQIPDAKMPDEAQDQLL